VSRVSTDQTTRFFQRSERAEEMRRRAHRAIPAGAHTYSKGDDQFPELAPAMIESGSGSHVVDVDGNRFLDWGMGLRSVILGHAYPRVTDAVVDQVRRGTNFTRPSPVELELAEQLIDLIPCAEMVKFAKNGSDVTTAAVRLARAATGRAKVAFPAEHPFFSVDDWFIGSTAVDAGVPQAVQDLSLKFTYGDLASLERLFDGHPGEIACVITEAATGGPPPEGFLEGVRDLTSRHGAVLVFDEMITGFRWHARGAQELYGVKPDLATFGKAVGNGFSVSALVGRRDVMELGGLEHDKPRVFLLSTTHGGEAHALAAARETVAECVERDVAAHLWRIGGRLQDGVNAAARSLGIESVVACTGYACSPAITFTGADATQSAGLRTLFLQETIARGVLIPYIAPSFSHTDEDVDRTVAAAAESLAAVRDVLDGQPLADRLVGPAARPVFRKYNFER
jgi:glutamate-1-semialdehyde 2,1-aminomutase